MKKLILLSLTLLLCLGAFAIDTTSKDFKSELEKQLGYKLPKLKDGGKYKPIENNHIPVYVKKSGIYFCDLQGNQVTPIYKKVMDENNGYYPVLDANGWGFIDTKFKEVLPCKYRNLITRIVDGVAAVETAKDTWKLIDLQEQTLLSGIVDTPKWSINLNCWLCKGSNGWGIATTEGKLVVPMSYTGLYTYDGEVAIVESTKDVLELFNCTTQRKVSKKSYSACLQGKNGVVAMKETVSQKWGILNKDGEELTPFTFETTVHVKPLLDYYSENPTTPLTDAKFQQLSRVGHPKRNTYKIDETIPNEIWNY